MNEVGELLHIDEPAARRIRKAALAPDSAERVAAAMKALSDPTRLHLAMALREQQELCVCDLSWIVQRTQNLVSHHMKVLRTDGLVSARKEGKMTMFTLTDKGRMMITIAGHLADGPAR